jgi:hypothetical protein
MANDFFSGMAKYFFGEHKNGKILCLIYLWLWSWKRMAQNYDLQLSALNLTFFSTDRGVQKTHRVVSQNVHAVSVWVVSGLEVFIGTKVPEPMKSRSYSMLSFVYVLAYHKMHIDIMYLYLSRYIFLFPFTLNSENCELLAACNPVSLRSKSINRGSTYHQFHLVLWFISFCPVSTYELGSAFIALGTRQQKLDKRRELITMEMLDDPSSTLLTADFGLGTNAQHLLHWIRTHILHRGFSATR